MNTKLPLRLDEKLILDAKRVARSRRVSLSKIVSEYFRSISAQQKKESVKSPILSEISGIFSSRTDKSRELKSYRKHLERKYF